MKASAFFLAALALAASAATTAQTLLDPQELEQIEDGISPIPLDPQELEQIEDGNSAPELTGPPLPAPPKTFGEKYLDTPHDYVSRRFESYSRNLDDFFSDPNRVYDSTGSTLQIRGHITFFESGVRDSKTDVHANISLPNTEDRLKLIVQRGVESATQTAAERDIKNATGSAKVAAPGAPEDNRYYLGLKALGARTFGVTLSAEAGARFHTPIDTYVRLRFVRDFNSPQWQIRHSETPLWKHSEGYSSASELNFTRLMDEQWQLRFTSKATWRSATSYFDLAQISGVYFTPNERTAMNFELGAFAPSDRHLKLSVYSVTFRVRRQIYRDWLYLDVTPQVLYQEANHYSAARSLMLQLEMLFGDRYLGRDQTREPPCRDSI